MNEPAINLKNLFTRLGTKAYTMDVETGFEKLDSMNVFKRNHLTILASRPEMEKDILAISLCDEITKINNQRVMFFSLRSTAQDITLHMLARSSGMRYTFLQRGQVSSADEWLNLQNTAARLADTFFYMEDSQYIIEEMIKQIEEFKEKYGEFDLLVIDSLPYIRLQEKPENFYQGMSDIIRLLKILAKQLNIPILLLTNICRRIESRADARPYLSDLKESGLADEMADTVLFLYRDIVYNPDYENPALAELIIAKNDGPTGTVYLHFAKDIPSFQDVEQE